MTSRRKPRELHRRLCDEHVLWGAWSRVASGTGLAGADGVTTKQFARSIGRNITQLREQLDSGEYRPHPLRTMTRKRDDKERVFAIATVRDRVAQRAALDCVGRRLDKRQIGASFAYRRGRSWLDALRQVERAREAGNRWVYRCDIRAFFDSVPHELLRHSLHTALAHPGDVDLMMGWLAAPYIGANGTDHRSHGIPLGLPIAGAAANHYLVSFDQLFVDDRFGRLVRYADDIAIMCNDELAARRAGLVAEVGLRSIRLEANRNKSYVSNFDRGFSYLGWTFFGDGGFQEGGGRSAWVHPMSVGR